MRHAMMSQCCRIRLNTTRRNQDRPTRIGAEECSEALAVDSIAQARRNKQPQFVVDSD